MSKNDTSCGETRKWLKKSHIFRQTQLLSDTSDHEDKTLFRKTMIFFFF